MKELLTTEQMNLSNWVKNMNSYPIFENTFTDGNNVLKYQGGNGYERIYLPIQVQPDSDYEFSLEMCSPSGFTFGGYDRGYSLPIGVTGSVPNTTSSFKTLSNVLVSYEITSNEASVDPVSHRLPFNSGSFTTVYLFIDFGYLTDYRTVTLNINDIRFTDLKVYGKSLVRSEGKLFTVKDNALFELTATDLTAELFRTEGVDDIPSSDLLVTLIDPEVLKWIESMEEDIGFMTAHMTAIPPAQTLESEDYDMNHSSIVGIEKALAECSENVRFAVSFDSGQIWKTYTGTEWGILSEGDTGMSAEIMAAISSEDWNAQATGKFRFRVTLPTKESTLTSLVVDYINA